MYHIDGQYQTVSASPFCPLSVSVCSFFKFVYVFLIVLGLCCCSQAFLQLQRVGGYLLVVVRMLLIAVASIIAEHGLLQESLLQRCGARVLPHSMWDLPGQGIKPISPELAGRFLTTGPPGKSCMFLKRVAIYPCICFLHFALSSVCDLSSCSYSCLLSTDFL